MRFKCQEFNLNEKIVPKISNFWPTEPKSPCFPSKYLAVEWTWWDFRCSWRIFRPIAYWKHVCKTLLDNMSTVSSSPQLHWQLLNFISDNKTKQARQRERYLTQSSPSDYPSICKALVDLIAAITVFPQLKPISFKYKSLLRKLLYLIVLMFHFSQG